MSVLRLVLLVTIFAAFSIRAEFSVAQKSIVWDPDPVQLNPGFDPASIKSRSLEPESGQSIEPHNSPIKKPIRKRKTIPTAPPLPVNSQSRPVDSQSGSFQAKPSLQSTSTIMQPAKSMVDAIPRQTTQGAGRDNQPLIDSASANNKAAESLATSFTSVPSQQDDVFYRQGANSGNISPNHWGQHPLYPEPETSAAAPWERDPAAIDPGPGWEENNPANHRKTKGPSLGEILNKGQWFASIEAMMFEPFFQGATAISTSDGSSISAGTYDFGLEWSPRINIGFESAEGPGSQVTYWNFDHSSSIEGFTSDGITNGTSSIYLLGPERWSRISTLFAGETLATQTALEAQSLEWLLFKELKFPVSRLKGILGLTYSAVTNSTTSTVRDAGGLIGSLTARHEFEGVGPTVGFAYRRPVLHSRFQFQGGMKSALLLGKRDQQVANTFAPEFNRFGADEIVANLHAHLGVSYVHHVTRYRSYIAKVNFEAQHWFGGGTAIDPIGDFGLYGLTFGVGVNR